MMEASFCHASVVGYVAAETRVVVEVWGQGDGRSLVRVLSLRKGEHCLAVPYYLPLCFKKFIPLSAYDFAEQLHEYIFVKSTIAQPQKESCFKFFEVLFLRIVPHITL